jgi:hypothetical protein
VNAVRRRLAEAAPAAPMPLDAVSHWYANSLRSHAMSLSSIRTAGLLALVIAATARPQATIRVNDSINLRIGLLSQTWADYSQNVRQDTSYAQSIYQRRIRFLVGGQVGSHLAFFYETDNPNLGRAGGGTIVKTLNSGFITQDAYVEVRPGRSNALLIDGGLQLVPLCRNCLQSAATLLPLDYGSYSFLSTAPTGSSVGRDVGFLAKGYLVNQRLEYRAGIFSGLRNSVGTTQLASNSQRYAARLQYNFLDPETPSYTYTGTYLGTKRVLAIGAGIDGQSQYKAWAADAFFDHPIGPGAITLQGDYVRYDGGTTGPFSVYGTSGASPYIAKENTFDIEAGYFIREVKVTPWIKWEGRLFDSSVKGAATANNQDERRFQAGGTWYVGAHNLNLKAAYSRNSFDRFNLPALVQNGFTLQLQGFYY